VKENNAGKKCVTAFHGCSTLLGTGGELPVRNRTISTSSMPTKKTGNHKWGGILPAARQTPAEKRFETLILRTLGE
jgi:hypothetical protein